MRKVLFLSFLLALGLAVSAQAQQGCCSHHGGVCNCACCDGSPLSNACRPFFPCGGGSAPSAPSFLGASALSGNTLFSDLVRQLVE